MVTMFPRRIFMGITQAVTLSQLVEIKF